MKPILLNMVLALVLFLLNGQLGRIQYGYRNKLFQYGKFGFAMDEGDNFSGNFFLKIINPTIFAAICCAIAQSVLDNDLCHSLWLIVPSYWGLRILYIAAKNYFRIINWKYELFSAGISLLLAAGVFFIVIIPLLDSGESIFIPVTALRDAVWYAIIAYLAVGIWNIGKTRLDTQSLYPAAKRREIVMKRYGKFSKKYACAIFAQVADGYPPEKRGRENFVCLVYAIMIFEDFNRPYFWRILERVIKFFWRNREMSLGIMQFKTKTSISDEKSIELAIKKLLPVYLESFQTDPIGCAIQDYNHSPEYLEEVTAIYDMLLDALSMDALSMDALAEEEKVY